MTRSICGRALQAWPWLEREPRIHWMADRNSEKLGDSAARRWCSRTDSTSWQA